MQWNIPASFAQFAETISSMARLQFAKKLPLGIWGAQPPQAYITPFTPSYAVCISGLSTANQMTAGFVAWMSSDLAGTNIVSQKKCGAKWDANTASYVQDELIVFDSIDGSQSTYYYWVAVVDTIGNISNATGPVAYAAGQSFGVPVDYAPTFSQGSSGIKLSANPSIPAASQPTLGSVAGGSLPSTTYYVQILWFDAGGTGGLPSLETSITLAADELLTVTNAAAPSWAASWNVYVATASGYETLQNTTPIPISTAVWTEPTSGLTTTGATPPTSTTMTPQGEGVLMYNAYWNTLNNAPSSTTAPNLPSSSDATWSLSMTSGETAYIWVQSIDVEGLTTEWISLGSFTNGTLDAVSDGSTYKKITAVSTINQATTGSIEPGAISASAQQSITTYVNITSSGQIASATITPTGGYVRLTVSGAIASTNATATGWALFFYKNGAQMTPSFQYQVFDSAEVGNSAYKAFSFCILDTSPGTSSATYSATVTTNTNGTVSLIPVVLIVENMKV